MDGAKIFFSHMVKARIFFLPKPGPEYLKKKNQAPPPPGSLMVETIENA